MSSSRSLLVATAEDVVRVFPERGTLERGRGLEGRRPTCLAADLRHPGRAWCGTLHQGVYGTDDGGASWRESGLTGAHVTALAADPVDPDVVHAGTEPSAIWTSRDGGASWEPAASLLDLPSSDEWSFPPKPDTHHVRWIACHPAERGRWWVAIEAGALLRTFDGGETWLDRVADGPFDTHELAVHAADPETLRVSAGDGYFESPDGGESWREPRAGLEVGYLRSVAIDPGDPEVIVVSASSRARSAYVAGHSDGRVYRREGAGAWRGVMEGWPDPPETIAPLLLAGEASGELWAADERGVHRSEDGGRGWTRTVPLDPVPSNLRGFVRLR